MANFMNALRLMRSSMTVNTDFENITRQNPVDRIHKEIDQNKIPSTVFLNLSNAFDTLDHNTLLHKF